MGFVKRKDSADRFGGQADRLDWVIGLTESDTGSYRSVGLDFWV